MILTLFVIAALQATGTEAGGQSAQAPQAASTPATSARPAAAARSNRRAPPVCQNRARTGSVLRREFCISAEQAASQQSTAKQHIEEATAGVANQELPVDGVYRPL